MQKSPLPFHFAGSPTTSATARQASVGEKEKEKARAMVLKKRVEA